MAALSEGLGIVSEAECCGAVVAADDNTRVGTVDTVLVPGTVIVRAGAAVDVATPVVGATDVSGCVDFATAGFVN